MDSKKVGKNRPESKRHTGSCEKMSHMGVPESEEREKWTETITDKIMAAKLMKDHKALIKGALRTSKYKEKTHLNIS